MSGGETSDDAAASVLMLSGDLMFASRVRGAAEAAGYRFQLSGDLPADASSAAWIVVDLATRSSVVPGLAQRCQAVCPQARIIAYGPHVQVERLETARASGIPTVVTRGQFDRSLSTLFGR